MRAPFSVLVLTLVAILTACHDVHSINSPAPVPMPEVTQKLDPPLRALAGAAQSKDAAAIRNAAKTHGISLENGLVKVQISADKLESVEAVQKLVTDSGGQVTAHLKVIIFALIAPGQIQNLAADARVWNMTIQGMAYPMTQ